MPKPKTTLHQLKEEEVQEVIRAYVKKLLSPGRPIVEIRRAIAAQFNVVDISLSFHPTTKNGKRLHHKKGCERFSFGISHKTADGNIRCILG